MESSEIFHETQLQQSIRTMGLKCIPFICMYKPQKFVVDVVLMQGIQVLRYIASNVRKNHYLSSVFITPHFSLSLILQKTAPNDEIINLLQITCTFSFVRLYLNERVCFHTKLSIKNHSLHTILTEQVLSIALNLESTYLGRVVALVSQRGLTFAQQDTFVVATSPVVATLAEASGLAISCTGSRTTCIALFFTTGAALAELENFSRTTSKRCYLPSSLGNCASDDDDQNGQEEGGSHGYC